MRNHRHLSARWNYLSYLRIDCVDSFWRLSRVRMHHLLSVRIKTFEINRVESAVINMTKIALIT